jgi:hypothetical protein
VLDLAIRPDPFLHRIHLLLPLLVVSSSCCVSCFLYFHVITPLTTIQHEVAMAFTEQEKTALLQLKGVGPTVIQRFEQIGLDSFEKLASHSAAEIAERVAAMLRTSCWKNSPQALAAIEAAIQRSAQGL